jgi:hypothetical protein
MRHSEAIRAAIEWKVGTHNLVMKGGGQKGTKGSLPHQQAEKTATLRFIVAMFIPGQ